MLRGPDTLGSTTSLVGIYSIMRAIQVIAEYGVKTYMPWFEQHILDSTSSGTDALSTADVLGPDAGVEASGGVS